jgi:hypothetical protein
MTQDALHGGAVLDERQEAEPPATAGTRQHVEPEGPALQLGPTIRTGSPLCGETVLGILRRTRSRLRARFSLFDRNRMQGILVIAEIYGAMAYSVTKDRRAIGIRMALGAQLSVVIRLVLGQCLALTVAGLVIGIRGAAGVTRYLDRLLFRLTALDPSTLVSVGFAALRRYSETDWVVL